jgi:hypothetical protein
MQHAVGMNGELAQFAVLSQAIEVRGHRSLKRCPLIQFLAGLACHSTGMQD